MVNDNLMSKNGSYLFTIAKKRKICEWKLDSPANSVRNLAEEATASFWRKIFFQIVAKVLKKNEKPLDKISRKVQFAKVNERPNDSDKFGQDNKNVNFKFSENKKVKNTLFFEN